MEGGNSGQIAYNYELRHRQNAGPLYTGDRNALSIENQYLFNAFPHLASDIDGQLDLFASSVDTASYRHARSLRSEQLEPDFAESRNPSSIGSNASDHFILDHINSAYQSQGATPSGQLIPPFISSIRYPTPTPITPMAEEPVRLGGSAMPLNSVPILESSEDWYIWKRRMKEYLILN